VACGLPLQPSTLPRALCKPTSRSSNDIYIYIERERATEEVSHGGEYEECRFLGCKAVWFFVRTDVSEKPIDYIIRVTIIGELASTLAVSDDGSDMFLRKVGPYKNHKLSHPRRRHSSSPILLALHLCLQYEVNDSKMNPSDVTADTKASPDCSGAVAQWRKALNCGVLNCVQTACQLVRGGSVHFMGSAADALTDGL
jgi:hypothetical protein